MLRSNRAVLAALVFAVLPPLARAAEPDLASSAGSNPLIVVFDAERRLALVSEGTVVPKGLRISVQELSGGAEGGKDTRSRNRHLRVNRPLVFSFGEAEVLQEAREQAVALGLISTDRSAARAPLAMAQAQSCVDVLLYLAPNIFHRAINCSGDGGYALFSYGTTLLGTDLFNTNADPYHSSYWYCVRPNEVCNLFTDTAGFGGGAWTRSEAWIEATFHRHGPDEGGSTVYYSSISF